MGSASSPENANIAILAPATETGSSFGAAAAHFGAGLALLLPCAPERLGPAAAAVDAENTATLSSAAAHRRLPAEGGIARDCNPPARRSRASRPTARWSAASPGAAAPT